MVDQQPPAARRSRTRLVVQGLVALVLVVAILYFTVKKFDPLQVMLLTVDLAITRHRVVGPRLGHVGAMKEEDRQWRATRPSPSMA